jgi:replicative DNA helicase
MIFAAMCGLFARGEPVDLLTLSAELCRRGGLESAGGRPALGLMADEATRSTKAPACAEDAQ